MFFSATWNRNQFYESFESFVSSYRPEAMGVVTGCIFLISLFLFIPVPFSSALVSREGEFPHDEVCSFIFILFNLPCEPSTCTLVCGVDCCSLVHLLYDLVGIR